MSPKRPGTQDDSRDRRKTPTSGVRVTAEGQDWDDITGQYEGEELAHMREQREPRIRLAHLEAKMDAIQEQRVERFDRLDHTLERIDGRLSGYAERVIRAEHGSQSAWDAVVKIGPQLQQVVQIGGDVARMATSFEKLSTQFDAQDKRLSAIEKAQGEAAIRFEEHDKRDQAIAGQVDTIRADIDVLKRQRATVDAAADATAKVAKLVARRRAWWLSAKGVGTVLTALAAAIVTVIVAAQKGCLGGDAPAAPPAIGSGTGTNHVKVPSPSDTATKSSD